MYKAIKIVSLIVVLALVALVLPITTQHLAEAYIPPAEVWVAPPPLGNDSNPGTEAQPFATIQKGIDTVELGSGGTVNVAAGTYYENLLIYEAVDLVGAGAQDTIIDGGGSGRVIGIASNPDTHNTISGFTIQGGRYAASLWNPTNEQILYAGINLRFLKMLPHLSAILLGGGGILIGDTHIVTLNDCVIKDNITQRGGGITNTGQLYMNRCTVSGNTATDGGGGIFNIPGEAGESGKMWLTDCTISGNSAAEFGGGINNSGEMWLTNCTISGNSLTGSDGLGAGIYTNYHMELCNVTLAYNTATGGTSKGGGIASMPGNLTAFFKNCIVAHNTAGTSGTNNAYYLSADDMVSEGNNIDSENSCNFNQPDDLINTDPLLGPLQDNGGPTFTHALLHGSPAIDNGSCGLAVPAGAETPALLVDQRGVSRPQGQDCDIGAYELAQASVATATGTGTAYFSTLNGYITDLTALAESGLDCPPNEVLGFPHGLFSFTVTGITPGSSATIVIILPSNMPTDTEYWKCINGQWVDCTSLLGSNDGDNVLTLTITDGGLGDRDGVANGEIVDPGGPADALGTPFRDPAEGASTGESSATILRSPEMKARYLNVTPSQAYVNQPVTISTNVINDGGGTGSYNVILRINDHVEQTQMVKVGPGSTRQVKFTVQKSEPGTYTVAVGKEKGFFTIVAGGKVTEGTPVDGGIVALFIFGALVLIVVVSLLFAFRRS